MRLKSFHAASMTEAMRQVREALGEDAMIIASRTRRGGVEITAAAEPAPPPGPAPPAPAISPTARIERLAQALAYHGVPKRLNERLCLAAAALSGDDPVLALAGALDVAFSFQAWPERPERPILLIGPAGAGKTVTTAKLAARAVLAGGAITVITCDTMRAGGVAQLATFIDLMKQQMLQVDSADDLGAAVAAFRSRGPTFVDSFGVNPHSADEVRDLKRYIAAADMDSVLVLPASGDVAELADVATAFAGAGAKALFFTRLDASRRYGAALSAAEASGLPIAGASITPFVADGLHALNPVSLARILLRDPDEARFDSEFDEAAE